jgi:DNA repair protein RadC
MINLQSHMQVAEYLHDQFVPWLSYEKLWVLSVDQRRRLRHVEDYSDGHASNVTVSLRHAILAAKMQGASAIYLAHNHPGILRPFPSWPDWMSNMQARWLGWRLGVPVLDHVIMGSGQYHCYLSGDSRWRPLSWLFRVALNPARFLDSSE